MYGAIIGDVCGSIYEWNNRKTDHPEEIELINAQCYYTDDTILTVGIAYGLMSGHDYKDALLTWSNKYPNNGYGRRYKDWFKRKDHKPYNSFGNGSAMRVSPVGWYFGTLEETLVEAKKSAEVTHNHKEGIKGAQAVAAAIFLARNDKSKDEIKTFIEKKFAYNLHKDISTLRKKYKYDETCQGTVPPAILAFLESNNFENAIQTAISLGGDTDTLACITGSIAEAFYKDIPLPIIDFVNSKINQDMKEVVEKMYEEKLKTYGLTYYIQRGKIFDISI
jgi:ADP-ribosylglycohydrolase